MLASRDSFIRYFAVKTVRPVPSFSDDKCTNVDTILVPLGTCFFKFPLLAVEL